MKAKFKTFDNLLTRWWVIDLVPVKFSWLCEQSCCHTGWKTVTSMTGLVHTYAHWVTKNAPRWRRFRLMESQQHMISWNKVLRQHNTNLRKQLDADRFRKTKITVDSVSVCLSGSVWDPLVKLLLSSLVSTPPTPYILSLTGSVTALPQAPVVKQDVQTTSVLFLILSMWRWLPLDFSNSKKANKTKYGWKDFRWSDWQNETNRISLWSECGPTDEVDEKEPDLRAECFEIIWQVTAVNNRHIQEFSEP